MRIVRASNRTEIFAIAAFLLLVTGVRAGRTKVTEVEGITEYKYDNGLQLLLFPDNSKPTVTVNVTYFVGSRHEGRGEKGMAHLLEHLVFKGTPDHPDIWKALENHGARFNGTTWVDRTNYFETLPTTEPGNLEWALKMEADRMINSFIRQEDLDTEMTVVRNEFEMGENNPMGVLMERIMSTAYLWHNYGDSTIGNRSDIERVPINNLKAFYKKYYQPDNAMLVVAGDFKPEEALKLVDKYFGTLPKPARDLDATYTVEPVQDGARHVELRRTGDVAACGSAYHISSAVHPDYPALEVIEQVLSDEPSGRLYKALVESGMAASVFTSAFGWKEPGVMINMAQVRLEDPVDPVLEKMNEVIEGLDDKPVTEEEYKRARTKLLKNIELALKNSQRIAISLSNWAAAGDWRLFFLHRDRLEKLTLDHVRAVASKYFKPSNRTTGVFYPTKEIDRTTVPETPDVVALLSDYEGKEALAKGEEFEATPENIEKRVDRFELSNGMELALLAKETRGDAVQALLTLRFGTEEDIKGRTAAIGLLSDMLMRGTDKYTYQQIRDKLDELKASVRIFNGNPRDGGLIGARIQTDREHLADVIDFVGHLLRNSTFPKEEFEIVKKEQLARMEEQLSQPTALAFNSVMRRLNPWPSDDVRYVPTLPESIERLRAVKLDHLEGIHKNLLGASYGQMTVVGDFDEGRIKGAVEKAFGTWQSPKPFARVVQKFRGDVKGSSESIDTPDKKMAMVACAVNMELRDDEPEYAALHIANYILGASAKARLMDRLRQKEGLSYGARSLFSVESKDRDAMWGGYAICAPENADKAYASLIDEFEKFARDGVGADELKDAQKSFALQVENQLANDGAVAGMLNSGLYLDRTMKYHKNLYEKIGRLTAEQVNKAIKRHLDVARLVKVKAGDLSTAASDETEAPTSGTD